MIVSSTLFEAYLECRTECWLRSRAEPASSNAYAEWTRAQNNAYCERESKRLLARIPEHECATTLSFSRHSKETTGSLATNVCLRANAVESRLQLVEAMPFRGRDGSVQFLPHRFEFVNKLTKNHKLLLAFDAHVLSEVLGHEVNLGKITRGEGHITARVKLSSLVGEVQKRINEITALLADNSPPDLILNRHCAQCDFQTRCRKQATEKDELSLLSGMTEKERKKLHTKGIFTVTQLSHTFRPRRRRRELRGRQERFHHSLRALAIRENKIHVAGLLDPKLNGTPVYLDVEGLPDSDFYYLIGIRIGAANGAAHYSFWADDEKEEKRIWNEFLTILSTIPDPQLVHFGSYERVFLKRMCKRYGGPSESSSAGNAIEHSVNLLSFVFARIYFPTLSNGLKDIAGYFGFRWAGSPEPYPHPCAIRSRKTSAPLQQP